MELRGDFEKYTFEVKFKKKKTLKSPRKSDRTIPGDHPRLTHRLMVHLGLAILAAMIIESHSEYSRLVLLGLMVLLDRIQPN